MSDAARQARPASADARRRSMIGKFHVAKKQLRMAEDDYRALLLRVTGEASSAQASINKLEALIGEFERLGFKPLVKPLVPRARAKSPPARKARALWISLFQLGVVNDNSEAALEAFAKRQLKCTALAWADATQMFKLIEALKAMAERNGWSQDTKYATDASHGLAILKLNLALALLAKMKSEDIVPDGWSLSVTVWRFLGMQLDGSPINWGVETLDAVVVGLADRRVNTMSRDLRAC